MFLIPVDRTSIGGQPLKHYVGINMPKPAARILSGDTEQCTSFFLSENAHLDEELNVIQPYSEWPKSFMERALACGAPSSTLWINHRGKHGLPNFISNRSYHGMMHATPEHPYNSAAWLGE